MNVYGIHYAGTVILFPADILLILWQLHLWWTLHARPPT